jgi:hypothetical protein
MTLQHVSLSFRISTLSNDCGIFESIVLICFFLVLNWEPKIALAILFTMLC